MFTNMRFHFHFLWIFLPKSDQITAFETLVLQTINHLTPLKITDHLFPKVSRPAHPIRHPCGTLTDVQTNTVSKQVQAGSM